MAVRRGATVSLFTKTGAKLAAFLMTMMLARNMAVADFGTFAFVSTWLLFFVIVSVAGLDTAALRYVAQFGEEDGGESKIALFVRWARRRVLLVSAVVAILTGIVLVIVGARPSQLSRQLILAAMVVLPLLSLTQFQQFVFRARREVGRADLVGQIIRPSVVIGIVVVASMVAIELSDVRAMLALLAGTFVSAAVGEYWLRRTGTATFAAAPSSAESRNWSRTALPMMLITGSHFLLHQLDILMLGSIAGSEHVAPYAVASRLADVVAFSLVVASSIVAPMISSLYHSGRRDELRGMLRSVARWVSLAAVIVAIALGALREPLLGLFGPEYVSAKLVLLILVVGQLINAIAGPVGFLLSMTGNQQGSARILGAGVLLNAALNVILIPIYKELGAAFATALTTVFWNASLTIYAYRKLGIRATPI